MSPHNIGSTYFDNSDIYLIYGSILEGRGGEILREKASFYCKRGLCKISEVQGNKLIVGRYSGI